MKKIRKEKELDFKRGLIIEVVEKLLVEKNYEDITIDEIVKLSEFARGSIYKYFDDKVDILVAVLVKTMKKHRLDIQEKCCAEPDAVKALGKLIKLEFAFLLSKSWIFRFSVSKEKAITNSESRERVIAQYEQQVDLVASIIEPGQKQGHFIAADPHLLARTILGIIRGYGVRALSNNIPNSLSDLEIELATSIIIRGIMCGSE